MLLNPRKKIIILQPPKTAGRFKEKNFNNKEFISTKDLINENYPFLNPLFRFHTTYSDIQKYYKEELKDWTIYVMIRNPYNHFVSVAESKEMNFSGVFIGINKFNLNKPIYILNTLKSNPNILTSLITHKKAKKWHTWLAPQSFYLGPNVKILKYESMDDWKTLCDLLKINIRDVKIKRDYVISDELKQEIKNIYYQYDKDIFNMYEL